MHNIHTDNDGNLIVCFGHKTSGGEEITEGVYVNLIAKMLGDGWTAERDENSVTLNHPSLHDPERKRCQGIWLSESWNKPGRIQLHAFGHSISVSADKSPLNIANDIKRRLLPDVLRSAEETRARWVARSTGKTLMLGAADCLRRAMKGHAEPEGSYGCNDTEHRVNGSLPLPPHKRNPLRDDYRNRVNLHLGLNASDEDVHFDRLRLPHWLAVKVVQLLATELELEEQHAAAAE